MKKSHRAQNKNGVGAECRRRRFCRRDLKLLVSPLVVRSFTAVQVMLGNADVGWKPSSELGFGGHHRSLLPDRFENRGTPFRALPLTADIFSFFRHSIAQFVTGVSNSEGEVGYEGVADEFEEI